MNAIEILESRIALAGAINATTAIFTDVDGDLVTVKFSKPIAQQVLYTTTFGAPSISGSEQLLRIDLINVAPAAAKGVNITFTAVPKDGNGDGIKDGDGKVNVGEIRAFGKQLGAVSVPGDLGSIDAGTGGPGAVALGSLKVQSLGEYGLATGAADLVSSLGGSVGSISIEGNLRDASILISAAGSVANLGTLAVGGSVIGGDSNATGFVTAGAIGIVNIRGDIVGGAGDNSGRISVPGKIASLTVGGSLLGYRGDNSGTVRAGELGTARIGRDLVGGTRTGFGNGLDSGVIEVAGKLGRLSLGGSVLAADATGSARIKVGGDAGSITIAGSLVGGWADGVEFNGLVEVTGKLTKLHLGGSILGGQADFSAGVFAGTLVTATIRGDVRGGVGDSTGQVSANSIGTLSIGGSLIGGSDPDPSDSDLDGITSGNVISGAGIARLSIGGDIHGGSGIASGGVVASTIGVLTVRGSITGGPGDSSGSILTTGKIGTIQVGGDLIGGARNKDSGQIAGRGGIAKVVIGGSVVGALNGHGSGVIDGGTGRIDVLTIGGDLRGGMVNSVLPEINSGSIHARELGAVTIGGSVIAGVKLSSGTIARAGWINADEQIGSLTVKGGVIGDESNPVVITAGGKAPIAPTIARPEPGIGAITIGGTVDHTFILAGYNKNSIAVSADASVGAVKVGGDWIASYLTAGVQPGADLLFGTADDRVLRGGEDFGAGPVRDNLSISKIASIVIGGQIKSGYFPAFASTAGNQTYGFVAQHIGSFKYGGIVVPLKAGPSNDTFAVGTARPLGASRSSLNTDGFAMHVFEV
jgi:hypothetical protein